MRTILIILVTLLLLGTARNPAIDSAEELTDTMGVAEIKPGMRGIGKTVFKGTKIEEFQFEVLGVLHNAWGAKSDIILVRLEGGPPERPLSETGLIAGMSGSPLYIDGKLIGAVAYGFQFTKEPIAGVTAIGEMLSLLDTPSEVSGFPDSGTSYGYNISSSGSEQRTYSLEPIQTPLMVSGMDPRVIAEMREQLAKYGLIPLQSGGAVENNKVPVEFEPGAAVGAELVHGDLNLTAIGTLTYRSGNRVLAFGHPFFWLGDNEFPMTAGYVHTVMPSLLMSFKLSSSLEPVLGKISIDKRAAIGGIIGEYTELLPFDVQIMGASIPGKRTTYHYEIIKNKYLAPSLTYYCGLNSFLATEAYQGGTVRLTTRIKISGRDEPITLSNVYAHPATAFVPALQNMLGAGSPFNPIGMLLNNSFEVVRLEKIEMMVEIDPEVRLVEIEKVFVDHRQVKPGETVTITAVLKAFAGERYTRSFTFTVPETTPEGKVLLTVCSGGVSNTLERSRKPGKFQPHSLAQLITLFEERKSNDLLVMRAFLPNRGVTVDGEELPSLPSSLLTIMGTSNRSGVQQMIEEEVMEQVTEWALVGSQSIVIEIKE